MKSCDVKEAASLLEEMAQIDGTSNLVDSISSVEGTVYFKDYPTASIQDLSRRGYRVPTDFASLMRVHLKSSLEARRAKIILRLKELDVDIST